MWPSDLLLVTDDTAAINAAISAGNRCSPGVCKGSVISPATVYFPSGYVLKVFVVQASYLILT